MLYYILRELFEGRHYAYENPLFRGMVAAIFCFLAVLLAMPATIRLLLRWKLGDQPEFDHDTLNQMTRDKKNVPTMGGILIASAIFVATVLLADLTSFYVRMGLVCLVWLGLLGGVDDWMKLTAKRRGESRDGLKVYEKLLFQIGLSVVLGYYVYRHGQHNFAVMDPLTGAEEVPSYRILGVPFYKPGLQLGTYAFMIVTVLVMTGSSNAVNLTDGMDGLAAGCTAICMTVLGVLCYVVGTEESAQRLLFPYIPRSIELVVLCSAVVGACLGFLWHNCHPAKVFMGDTGSLPLGGLMGFVAIVTRQELMLFIAGGVFVLEALSVMIQVGYFKASGGKRVFRCAPLHHHFHLGGWSEPKTVVRFWLLAALFAGCALATIKLR